jgi:hypothetical protein
VRCCCGGAHQPSSAGENALFASITTTMPKTFMTMKAAQKMIGAVVLGRFRPRWRIL